MTAPRQQKLKVHGPVVVTANRLGDGAVVYRAALGGWTTRLEAAAVVTTAQDAKTLLAAATADDLEAVGPYVAPVDINGGRIKPGNLRERIRRRRPDLRSAGGAWNLTEFEPCTSMTISTAPWSPNASPNSAIRWRGGCPAN